MENVYENVRLLQKYKLNDEQTTIESQILLENDVAIKKVLSVDSKVNFDMPIEALDKESNITGNIVTCVIYMNENGEINNQVSQTPFVYKIKSVHIDSSSKINLNIYVVACDIDKVVSNQLKVLTTLNIGGIVVKNVEKPIIKETKGNTYIKQVEQEIVALDKQNCDKFDEILATTVKDGVKKILNTSVECVIQDYASGTNFIQVEGELYAKILYVNNLETPELQTITISKAFKHELEADGVNRDSILDVFAYVINEKVDVEIEERENSDTGIAIKTPIIMCFNVYECNKILSTIDVYSTEELISIHKEECFNYINLSPEFLTGKIEGNVMLTDDEPRVDKLIATTNVCTQISNSYLEDNVLNVEGIISTNVIYLNDEQDALQSVQIEIPYVLEKKVDLPNDALLEPFVTIYDVDVIVKRGREIYFDAKAKAYVNVSTKNDMCVVTKTEVLDVLPKKDSAIEIYFAKVGESFWDIAKNLKIAPELIARQNPHLTDPLEKNENIAIYYQKQRKI